VAEELRRRRRSFSEEICRRGAAGAADEEEEEALGFCFCFEAGCFFFGAISPQSRCRLIVSGRPATASFRNNVIAGNCCVGEKNSDGPSVVADISVGPTCKGLSVGLGLGNDLPFAFRQQDV
jgi:hypothetical protein